MSADFDFDDQDPFADLNDFESLDDDRDGDDALERFEAEVDRRMRIAQSKKADASDRLEAVRWLGESGSPKAIVALRKVYNGETDKRLKSAAEYALGQFKMLDMTIERDEGEDVLEALERPENEWVVDLLQEITLSGGGTPKRGAPVFVKRLIMLLTLSLVFLIVLNVLALMGDDDGSNGTSVASVGEDHPSYAALQVLADLNARAQAVEQDAVALREQFAEVSNGGVLDCVATFNRAEIFIISPDTGSLHPDFVSIAIRLNSSLATVNRVLGTYDTACASGATPDAAAVTEAESLLASVVESEVPELMRLIADTETNLLAVESENGSSDDPTVEPTTEPEPVEAQVTLEPTTVPPTPIPVNVLIGHRSNLLTIIGTVNEPRGALTRLNQYWTDVQNSGTTLGCNQARPNIPNQYTAIEPEVAAAYPELQAAADEINGIGLALLANGWNAFDAACAQGNLAEQVATGLTIVQTVQSALDEARVTLQGLEF